MGERYWMTVALAKGMCRIVWKNSVKAIMPETPRNTSHFLLCPKRGSPLRQIQTAQKRKLMALLKKTSWGVGRMAKALTKRLAEV